MKPSAMKTTIISAFCLISISFVACHDKKQEWNVYEFLWIHNMDIANSTLYLDFMQHMEVGDLRAERYVSFTIQDINYVVKVTEMLRKLSSSVKEPADLRQFFQGRYKSYKKFCDYLLNMYFLKGVSDIKPTPAMRKYLSDYETIMNTKEPIYFAVSLLPCSRLWSWLANQVNMTQTNAYFGWKKDNMGGNHEKHYKELLNKHLNTINKVLEAYRIFRMQMQNEHDFFASS
ncbi:uncharacterized protein LOC121697539 [Alosa sapidissima]|uniref:uncharacterized protein LOC121697539 n=1 Tax=Alosa sapidissima TaxID=34773 RepID=UPI001C08704A|nr:uncharacterized protein LOC121697539 [Alosa sapidissima]